MNNAGYPEFSCPLDRHSRLARSPEGTWSGELCKHAFIEENGFPNFVPSEDETEEPEHEKVATRKERSARDAQARIYDWNLPLKILGVAEIPMSLDLLGPRPGERILEVGCGTGRFTRHLASTGAYVTALDHSRRSLEVAHGRLSGSQVSFVQGTVAHLPFDDGMFDAVVSCQMLNHLPGDRLRQQAVSEMARVLVPGGRLFISMYRHSWWTRFSKEGEHPGGIYYYRFTRTDVESLLRPLLQIEQLRGDLGYLWMSRGRKAAAN